jgi:Zn-dependent protease
MPFAKRNFLIIGFFWFLSGAAGWAQDHPQNGLHKEYSKDGKILLEENYKDNLLEGSRRVYRGDGTLRAEQNFKAGKLDGTTKVFFKNGVVKSEYEYRGDQYHGEIREYYPSGTLKLSARYSSDILLEELKQYYTDGVLKSSGFVMSQESNPLLFGGMWFWVFMISLTFHEAAHSYVAFKLGDPTAYHEGQVTLNPLPHIRREPLGTIVVPILSYLSGGWMIGWASAPYDPVWALHHPRRSALMSLAGPLANLLLVLISALIIHVGIMLRIFVEPASIDFAVVVASSTSGFFANFAAIVSVVFSLNFILLIFNLLPFPPLDGSGILPLFMKHDAAQNYLQFIAQPAFGIVGLFAAWQIMDYIFPPLQLFCINLLYPYAGYGS